MKSISVDAMAAIIAGEALVTGAVELTPAAAIYSYSAVTTVNLNGVTNAATTKAGGLTAGITVGGFSPTDICRISQPAGGTFTAIRPRSDLGWDNRVDIIPGGIAADSFFVNESGTGVSFLANHSHFSTAAAAQAAFGVHSFTGASTYTFYYFDDPTTDNAGGLSIAVEKGSLVTGGGASPLRLWGGYGPLTINGETFQGVGAHALAQQNAGAIGGIAQGISLGLSGIDEDAVALLDDAADFKGASAVVYRLIFANDGKTMLGAHVFDRGRLDTIQTENIIGGTASLLAAVESTARSLGKSGARMRSDSDQRLIDALDGYFRDTAYAFQKSLYWGGKKPATVG
jgi:hypothetical protein